MNFELLTAQAAQAVGELLKAVVLKPGSLFVVGCSSSEIVGSRIGKGSSIDAARAVYQGIAPLLSENGIYLAAQCCEHLNRALVIEAEAAEKYGYDIVSARPVVHAGGAFATTVYENMKKPVLVEEIRAHAGIDIGGTMIGMHIRRVAVPYRSAVEKIGGANIICAYARPKLIGGERAQY